MTDLTIQMPKPVLGKIFSYAPDDLPAIERVCKHWQKALTPQLRLEALNPQIAEIKALCFKDLHWPEIYQLVLEGRKPLENYGLRERAHRHMDQLHSLIGVLNVLGLFFVLRAWRRGELRKFFLSYSLPSYAAGGVTYFSLRYYLNKKIKYDAAFSSKSKQFKCYDQFSEDVDFARLAHGGVLPQKLCRLGLDVTTLLKKVKQLEEQELEKERQHLFDALMRPEGFGEQQKGEVQERLTAITQRFQKMKDLIIAPYNQAMVDWTFARFRALNPTLPLPSRENVLSGQGDWKHQLGLSWSGRLQAKKRGA